MREFEEKARCEGTRMKFAFLPAFDDHYSSAVSAGAALSAMRPLPRPAEVLVGSAIGIQRSVRLSPRSKRWIGEAKGDFLFCKVRQPLYHLGRN
jgi:hypothetical protein